MTKSNPFTNLLTASLNTSSDRIHESDKLDVNASHPPLVTSSAASISTQHGKDKRAGEVVIVESDSFPSLPDLSMVTGTSTSTLDVCDDAMSAPTTSSILLDSSSSVTGITSKLPVADALTKSTKEDQSKIELKVKGDVMRAVVSGKGSGAVLDVVEDELEEGEIREEDEALFVIPASIPEPPAVKPDPVPIETSNHDPAASTLAGGGSALLTENGTVNCLRCVRWGCPHPGQKCPFEFVYLPPEEVKKQQLEKRRLAAAAETHGLGILENDTAELATTTRCAQCSEAGHEPLVCPNPALEPLPIEPPKGSNPRPRNHRSSKKKTFQKPYPNLEFFYSKRDLLGGSDLPTFPEAGSAGPSITPEAESSVAPQAEYSSPPASLPVYFPSAGPSSGHVSPPFV